MSSKRMIPGGRQLSEQMRLDFRAARDALNEARRWNKIREPLDVDAALDDLSDALDRLETRYRYEVEPRLERREDNAPSLAEEIEELKRRVKALESERVVPFRDVNKERGDAARK